LIDCAFVWNVVGPTDCIVEGEVLKLGGPFLQTWQKKHLKLYPNRLEFYPKSRDGQIVKGKGVEVNVQLQLYICLCVFFPFSQKFRPKRIKSLLLSFIV